MERQPFAGAPRDIMKPTNLLLKFFNAMHVGLDTQPLAQELPRCLRVVNALLDTVEPWFLQISMGAKLAGQGLTMPILGMVLRVPYARRDSIQCLKRMQHASHVLEGTLRTTAG